METDLTYKINSKKSNFLHDIINDINKTNFRIENMKERLCKYEGIILCDGDIGDLEKIRNELIKIIDEKNLKLSVLEFPNNSIEQVSGLFGDKYYYPIGVRYFKEKNYFD